jgi:hypothetical protein
MSIMLMMTGRLSGGRDSCALRDGWTYPLHDDAAVDTRVLCDLHHGRGQGPAGGTPEGGQRHTAPQRLRARWGG